jgi:2'-5' RNA ligase superfamily/D-alanyl-D-alanine carboxypeptidase
LSTPQSQIVPDFDSYAASRSRVPDFDSYVASKKSAAAPSRPAPRSSAPASVNPQLDSFVNDVMGEASRRTGYTYKLGSGVRTPEEQAQKVAQGYSRTYDSKHLSGSARDVLAFDSSGQYIMDGQHPAYKALGDVYRERAASAPVSVKWGGDFSSFYDPGHFELGEAAQSAASVPDFDEYVKSKSAVPGFDEYVAQKQGGDDKPDVVINASRTSGVTTPSMPPLPSTPAPDVMTQEGRAQRDGLRLAESQPNARQWVDVRLPAGVRDWAQLSSNDVAKEGVRQWAAQRGIPSDFTEKWLADNGSDENLHLYDLATRKPLTTAEAMGREDIYDLNSRSFRLSAEMPQFKMLQDDYKLAQLQASGIPGAEDAKSLDDFSPGLRALTVDSDETSPGEKFLSVITPLAQGALRTADLATRPLQAIDAAFWNKVRGANDLQAIQTAWQQFYGDNPELGKNVIAEALRNSDRLRAVNPKLPSLLGELANIIVEPSNLALIGGAAAASRLLRGTAAAGRAGEAARGLGLLDRGFVEARPLGLGEAAFGETAREPLHVLLRGEDGANYLLHTQTGDVIDLSTGELLYEGGEPVEVEPRGDAPPAPENPTALSAQLEALKAGRRRAVLVTPGESVPEVPAGFVATQTERGVFIHDPNVVSPEEVAERAASGTHGELLGHVTPGDVVTNRVVTARDPSTGEELASSYVTPQTEAAQAAEYRSQFPGSETVAGGPELEADVLEGRGASAGEQPLHEYLEELTGRPAPELQPKPAPPPSVGARVVNISSDILNAPKSIKSSIALHGPFRQGVFQAAAHPSFLRNAIAQQVKAFASESAFRDFAQGLTERSWFKPMQDAGLFLPSTYDVEMGGRAPAWLREERFASAAAEKIPGVRASSRAYVGAMDSIRSQAVEHYLTTLYGPEMDLSKADPETLKALAEFVNISTGRGRVPILDRFAWGRKAVATANNLLWSPRAMASRFNLVSPYRLMMNAANPATRPVAALQAADSMRAALSVGATLSLLSLVPGVKVGLNPFKPGWGMVKVGNTEYDVLDGVPSTVKYAAQVGQALYLHAEGKPPTKIHGQEQTVYNLTKDFLRKRLSPSAQVAAEAVTGKNAMGEKVSGGQMASDLLSPFVFQEMYRGWLSSGFGGAVRGLPSALGIPTRTYIDRRQGSNDAGPPGEVLDSRSPAEEGTPLSNYMRLDNQRESANVEDRRFGDISEEIAKAGRSPLVYMDDREKDGIAEFLQHRLTDRQFDAFARSLDETVRMGVVGEAADAVGEAAARAMSRLGVAPADAAEVPRLLRVLARERRLRPYQFHSVVSGGDLSSRLMEHLLNNPQLYPQPRIPPPPAPLPGREGSKPVNVEPEPEAGDSYRHKATGEVSEVRKATDKTVYVGERGGKGKATPVPAEEFASQYEKTEHKFSSTQVDLPPSVAREVRALGQKLIPDSALYTDPDDPSYGREESPHVTVKYGLHDETPEKVRALLRREPPVTVTLGKTSIFPAKDGDPYDVVKVDVGSAALRRLNARIGRALKVTDTHPDYKPHLTLAYVRAGEGRKYQGDKSLAGRKVTIHSLTFSSSNGETVEIPFGGRTNA